MAYHSFVRSEDLQSFRSYKINFHVRAFLLPTSYHMMQFKGEPQRENELILYETVFKMLEKDMFIAGIGQAVIKL